MPFEFEERPSDSPFVQCVWRTQSRSVGRFVSLAVANWEIVFMRRHGVTTVSIRGPETVASIAECPDEAEFWGIQFKLGAFIPELSPAKLVDSAQHQELSGPYFRLASAAWQLPDFDNADVFLARLQHDGLLSFDPTVLAVLDGRQADLSPRTVQRRFRRAIGLSQAAVRQIERARLATTMLREGREIADVIEIAGYADQPHLTRALRRFAGQTPGELARKPQDMSL